MRQIKYCALQLHQMWVRGDSYEEIAATLGCSVSFIHHLKVRHKLTDRQRPTQEIFDSDPTPSEIAERAAEIRQKNLEALRKSSPKPVDRVSTNQCFAWDGYRFRSFA